LAAYDEIHIELLLDGISRGRGGRHVRYETASDAGQSRFIRAKKLNQGILSD
jgi:hypothetical protein